MSLSETLKAQDVCLLETPNVQSAIDLIPSWTSKLPDELNVSAGFANLFADGRVDWALQSLGGLCGKSVLELGPLEGGHTYMLERAGASEIVAIEANKLCFIKCLIIKEILGLQHARFLLGNFTPWLDAKTRKFDVVFAAGVLYHMDDPIRLIRQIGACTDQVYLWTHYIPDEPFGDEGIWTQTIVGVENRDVGDRIVPYYIKSYMDMGETPFYCGGVYTTASWLRCSDIFEELQKQKFLKMDVNFDVRDHQNGPCIAIAASR
jgi:SAM-dependent methyltransferase